MICLDKITKYYRKRPQAALDEINITIEAGEMIAVKGKSGSGKSTLLNIIGLLDAQTEGKYTLDGEEVSVSDEKQRRKLRAKIGIVLQNSALIPEKNLFENIALPLCYLRASQKAEIRKKVEEVAEKLGISDLLGSYPNKLSGGECQRGAIARALVTEPELLLADEPTGSVDSENRDAILSLFEELNQQGITILLVTHDAAIAARCQRVITLEEGKMIEDSQKPD